VFHEWGNKKNIIMNRNRENNYSVSFQLIWHKNL
jgi:hypothetical protein